MSEILEFLHTVPDERSYWKIKHGLWDIILFIFFARLCGAEYWEDIEDFGKVYEVSLSDVLRLENGIPSYDTMQRFATLDADVLVTVP